MSLSTTLYDSKRAFVEAQVRLLARPLLPSRGWSQTYPALSRSAILTRLLNKVHIRQQRYIRKVLSSQTIQHVALQIDRLHRNSRIKKGIKGSVLIAPTLKRLILANSDAWDSRAINELPPKSTIADKDGVDLTLLERYAGLRDRLGTLSSALTAARGRHESINHFYRILNSFTNPSQEIQPNLLFKECPVEKEIVRMRILLAKLSARIKTP
ncbi:kinetochore Sim4 complex subunit Fta4 [Dipodascopsis uninucleata]